MRGSGESTRWLFAAALLLTGCQQAPDPAPAEEPPAPVVASRQSRRHADKKVSDKTAAAKPVVPSAQHSPDPVSKAWNEPAPAKKAASVTEPVKTAAIRDQADPGAPALPAGRRTKEETSSPDSLRLGKTTTASAPVLKVGENTPTVTGKNNRGPTVSELPEAKSMAPRTAEAPAGLRPGETGVTGQTTATAPSLTGKTEARADRATAKPVATIDGLASRSGADNPAAANNRTSVALPAATENNLSRPTRIPLPVRLSEWLADEKAHEEWRRKQLEKQAATSAERETERRRLKGALDRFVLNEKTGELERVPAGEEPRTPPEEPKK